MNMTLHLRQCVGDVRVARRRSQLTAPGRNHDKLLPTRGECARRRIAGRRQGGFPKPPAGALVERTKLRVLRRCDENQPAAGDDRSAVLFGSSNGNSVRGERVKLAERDAPAVFAGVEINGVQRPPRWLDRGIASRVSPTLIAG